MFEAFEDFNDLIEITETAPELAIQEAQVSGLAVADKVQVGNASPELVDVDVLHDVELVEGVVHPVDHDHWRAPGFLQLGFRTLLEFELLQDLLAAHVFGLAKVHSAVVEVVQVVAVHYCVDHPGWLRVLLLAQKWLVPL